MTVKCTRCGQPAVLRTTAQLRIDVVDDRKRIAEHRLDCWDLWMENSLKHERSREVVLLATGHGVN